MAKTSFQLIPPEYDLLYSKSLTSGDRFVFPRVRKKVAFLSRNRVKGLTQKSLLPAISADWALLDSTTREAWQSAGSAQFRTGWQTYLRDKVFRARNLLSGDSIPSDFYQEEVGRLHIEAPASSIKIAQLHPTSYWVDRKVPGTKNQRQPILVTEDFALPLTISISYLKNLTSAGDNPRARFFCEVYFQYQGRIIAHELNLDFSVSGEWTRSSVTLSSVFGIVRGYTAFIEVVDSVGDVFFDNVVISHSGQNWARDPRCNSIASTFTRVFYQVPRHWVGIDLETGAFYNSFYYNLLE